MLDLYNNLLKATNNIDDITTEKYATVTKLNGNYCDAKEEDTGLEHTNVPIINGANLSVGDKAIIGFLNNSIYDVVCYGALDKTIHDDSKQDTLISGTNIKTINHQSLLGSGNITIEGGGGGSGGSYINDYYWDDETQDIILDYDSGVSEADIVTSWSNPLTDTKVASEKLVKNTIDGLSIPSKVSDLTNDTGYITSSSLPTKVSDLQNDTGFITSSSLPTKLSDLTNDSDFIETSSTSGLLRNDGTVDTTSYLSSLPSHNHDDRYYTESEMDTALNGKQATLVSGTNIKTINNNSLLGSGNIEISGGSSTGDYFFTMNSFLDPNQWTGSVSISNGSIVLSADSSFPLRLPPNCDLSFNVVLSNGYDGEISILNRLIRFMSVGVKTITISINATNNTATLYCDETGDEWTITDLSAETGLQISVLSGTTATISNIEYKDGNTQELYGLIGTAITYINQ